MEQRPPFRERMSGENLIEGHGIQNAGFDELEQPGLVLGTSGLQRDGGEIFRCEYPGRHSVNIIHQCFSQSFLRKRTRGREELHQPAGDDEVFATAGIRL